MPRRRTTPVDERRARRLADVLTRHKKARRQSVQQIADESRVPYETVRAVLSARSAGPSFFIVSDVAHAIGVDLDELAEESK